MALATIHAGVDSIGAPRRPLPVKGDPDRRRERRRAPDDDEQSGSKPRRGQTPAESDQHEGGIDELV